MLTMLVSVNQRVDLKLKGFWREREKSDTATSTLARPYLTS
jgi:hypothetical protein